MHGEALIKRIRVTRGKKGMFANRMNNAGGEFAFLNASDVKFMRAKFTLNKRDK